MSGMRILDYIETVEQRLLDADLCFGHGTDNAADEAYYLVLATLGINFDDNLQELQKPLDAAQQSEVESRLRRRIEEHVPVAYLVGEAWFAGYPFKIDERALIPRSPMAELIANAFKPLVKSEPLHVLDLCTGCGCIGIATALRFPTAEVDLLDISGPALSLARENIERYRLGDRVRTIESDLFDDVQVSYDLILANPPYVSAKEYRKLPEEYRHEPELGLVSGKKGLRIPLGILRDAAAYLPVHGTLIMEVGYSQQALVDRCPDVPFLWLEFEHGGEGVFALSQPQLLKYRECFI